MKQIKFSVVHKDTKEKFEVLINGNDVTVDVLLGDWEGQSPCGVKTSYCFQLANLAMGLQDTVQYKDVYDVEWFKQATVIASDPTRNHSLTFEQETSSFGQRPELFFKGDEDFTLEIFGMTFAVREIEAKQRIDQIVKAYFDAFELRFADNATDAEESSYVEETFIEMVRLGRPVEDFFGYGRAFRNHVGAWNVNVDWEGEEWIVGCTFHPLHPDNFFAYVLETWLKKKRAELENNESV